MKRPLLKILFFSLGVLKYVVCLCSGCDGCMCCVLYPCCMGMFGMFTVM